MVAGCSIAVTQVPWVSQCAEIQSIALGLGRSRAIFRKPETNSFSSIAFIGLPWPKKSTGILTDEFHEEVILFKCFKSIGLSFRVYCQNVFLGYTIYLKRKSFSE